MFSVTSDLVRLPFDPIEVCRVIEKFLKDWKVLEVGPAIRAVELEVNLTERRIGRALPMALRWMLTRVGVENVVIGHQDPLVRPQFLQINDLGIMVYRVENQGCAEWGVQVDDLVNPDPPVVWNDLQSDAEWVPYQSRVSIDLLEMNINEAMLLSGTRVLQAELISGVPPEVGNLLSLDIPSHVFWACPNGPPVRWFGMEDCLIRLDGNEFIWAFGRTEEAVHKAAGAIPGEWVSLEV